MSWRGFRARLRQGGACLLVLDFDGTLAAIRRDRRRAALSPRWRALLRALAGTPGLRLAFLSGRGLEDLRRRCPVPGACYVGNHGLAWHPRRLGPAPARQRGWRRRTRAALAVLRPLRRRYRGLQVEDKGLDLSLHLRGLSPARRRALAAELPPLLRALNLGLRRGRAVLELRPRDGWDKGAALRRLRQAHGQRNACLVAGDDRTDEQAFAALRGTASGFSYKIGPGPTRAMRRGSRMGLYGLLRGILAETSGGARR